jgi:Rieske Fe-S protein
VNQETVRRRSLIAGLGVVAGVAACGTGDGSAAAPAAPPRTAPTAGEIPISDIPVGGGTVYAARDTVVTQPTAGVFKAFGAACTHQGCFVSKVANGTIDCDCHGSKFSIADGSVTVPAPGLTAKTQPPLPPKSITVTAGVITID